MLRETLVHTPALGLRFHDAATGVPVVDDLRLAVRTRDRDVAIVAPRTPRGAFSAHAGAGDATVTVHDRAGRYLPVTIAVALGAGLVLDPCDATASPPGGVGLFSTPSRPAPPGHAAIRARLWDQEDERPASWARLDATGGGVAGSGLADARGNVLVLLPWPAPANGSDGPPPLDEATWDVALTAHWDPALAVAEDVPDRDIVPPDLCAVRGQPLVKLLRTKDGTAELPEQELAYGRELVVRSRNTSDLQLDPTP